MTNEEKILEILSQMQTNQDLMQDRLDKMDGRLVKMDSRLDKMDGRLDKMDGRLDRMEARQDKMDEALHQVKAYLELDVEKRFDAINEGIDTILEQIVPVRRVEALEEDVVVLKAAVRTLSSDVAELKKAQ